MSDFNLRNADIKCCATCKHVGCDYEGYECRHAAHHPTVFYVHSYNICDLYEKDPDYNENSDWGI